MSYEGYLQLLCNTGHQTTIDVYDTPSLLCHCGEPWVWWNGVNTTNGSFGQNKERIDGYVELQVKTPDITHTCSCGDPHYSSEATYQLPPEGMGHRGSPHLIHVGGIVPDEL